MKKKKRRYRLRIFPALLLALAAAALVGIGARLMHRPPAVDTVQSEVASSLSVPASPVSATWNLLLVNRDHPLPDGYMPELETVDARGSQFDVRAAEALRQMLDGAEQAGLSLLICSSYRTNEKQENLFNNKVSALEQSGLSHADAVAETATEIARPGTSEHQLGLAADIVALSYQILDDKQADTPEQAWLMEHCAEYGFILRYPIGKSDVTGVIYEPWHYRYVGKEAAAAITAQGVTLEEYLLQSN